VPREGLIRDARAPPGRCRQEPGNAHAPSILGDMRYLLVAAAIASAALAARDACADGTGVIAASERPDDRGAAAAALADAIATAGGSARVVGDAVGDARAARAAGAVPATTLARFRRVREMIDDGWRAFLRVQIDLAHTRLAAACGEALALVALPGGAELYADAALRLGAVMQHRQIPDAPGMFALAIALDPDRPITLAEFSPDVVDAVAAVRAAPAGTQPVHVVTRPAGAIVHIDGRPVGPAPVDAQLTRGPHVVVARAPLHRPETAAIAVDAPATVELALAPDDDAARLAAGASPGLAPPAEQALVDAALALADLDDVVVAAVRQRGGGPALVVQRCAGAPARCTAAVEVGYGDRAGLSAAAREAWHAVQRAALREPPHAVSEMDRALRSTGCALCRSPVVWAGAAVLATMIVIAVTSGGKPAPIVTIDGRDFGR